jgi:CRP-like cAMP-binding protein
VEESTLLVLHMDDFRTAVRDHPDIAFEVFREFSRRIRRADERIRSLAEELQRKAIETA